jgi:hypothetical protein
MTTSTVLQPGLEDLALDAIRCGRQLARAASLADLGAGGVTPFDEVAEVLIRLADRNPFNPADDNFLCALRVVLEAEVSGEVIGTERLIPSGDECEPGEYVLPRERPAYSARGRALRHILQLFDRFMAAREAALDRAAAERALFELRGT